jgi:hypothetical protein
MRYEIVVRFEDGTRRVITENSPPSWHTGDKVRMRNGMLSAEA